LDKASVFLESRHFKRRNIHGFKQDLKYDKLRIHLLVSPLFVVSFN
jgi:hypothetical protein